MNLEEMRAIEQAATEGPCETGRYWGALTHESDGVLGAYYGEDCPACDESLNAEAEVVIESINLDFIAAARTFVPEALDALEEILELHSHEVYDSSRRMCPACGGTVPCRTRRIIENKLGVQE